VERREPEEREEGRKGVEARKRAPTFSNFAFRVQIRVIKER